MTARRLVVALVLALAGAGSFTFWMSKTMSKSAPSAAPKQQYVAALHQLEPGEARDLVEANLRDEVSPPSHLELFELFANSFDATDAPPSPGMQGIIDAYDGVARRGTVAALAGLLAYESQGASVADSKGLGLAKHYEAPLEALLFWDEHGSIEGDHAEWTFDALTSLSPDLDEVRSAARLVGDAWWSFLDERELQAV